MNRYPLIITFILITLCLLPMMILRDFNPDNELRYLQIADEAIGNGSVFAFTFQGETYADKPPLYIWLVMLSRLILGKHSMLLLSLFSLIPAFVVVGVMDRWAGLSKPSDRVGVAFMMMTCALFLGASVFLRMDMLMTMFIVLALYSFWKMYDGPSTCPSTSSGTGRRSGPSTGSGTGSGKQGILFPVWIFLALFTKGPVGLLMPVLSITAFLFVKRKGSDIGRYLGWKTWGIIAGLCAIWFAGAYIEGGREYLNDLLFHQTFGRAFNSFSHKAPFWYYFVAVWYVTAPYMFLLVGSIVASFKGIGKEERQDRELFFLVTVSATFVMLSLFSGKLAVYLVPVLPFMVLLFIEVLKRTGWKKWMTWSLAVPCILLLAVALAALGILIFGSGSGRLSDLIAPYTFIRSGMVKFALFLLIQGLALALYYLLKRRPNLSLIFIGSSIFLAGYAASSVMPQLNDWIGYGNLCRTISPEEQVATLYLRRPYSMKVYLGKEVADYQRDFDAFYDSEIEGRTVGQGPLVLVTRGRYLERDGRLEEFAGGRNHWFVGPYCLVRVEPDNTEIDTNNINELKSGNYEQRQI